MSRGLGALGTGAALVGLCLVIFAVGVGARLVCRDVCGSDIGLLFWSRSAFWAGALLGAGAAAKLFPALYVAMLAASCVPAREWRRARQLFMGATVALGTIVVPLLVVAPHAVGYFLDFHAARSPTRGTLLSFILRNPALPD